MKNIELTFANWSDSPYRVQHPMKSILGYLFDRMPDECIVIADFLNSIDKQKICELHLIKDNNGTWAIYGEDIYSLADKGNIQIDLVFYSDYFSFAVESVRIISITFKDNDVESMKLEYSDAYSNNSLHISEIGKKIYY